MTTIENHSVLFAVSEYGEFSSLIPIAKEVETKLLLHPIFIFAPGYGMLKEHSRLIELESWSWKQLGSKNESYLYKLDNKSADGYHRVSHDGESKIKKTNIPNSTFFFIQLLNRMISYARQKQKNKNILQGSLHSFNSISELTSLLKDATKIFKETEPKLVISGQDFALSVTSILSHVAIDKGIKTLIIPFSMPPTTKEIIESLSYFESNLLDGFQLKYAKKILNSKWFNTRRGKTYIRVDLLSALISDYFNITPPNPWLPNSGNGIICAPSKWSYEYYKNEGVPESQLKLTGAKWSDIFVRAKTSVKKRRNRLMNIVKQSVSFNSKLTLDIALKNTNKLMIVSWPPNQYPRYAIGCNSYSDLCDQFISSINEIQQMGLAYVAVSLHPTVTDPELLLQLKKSGICVLRTNLIEYIDCADYFVATVSSTIFWALQSKIPSINFDGYMYGYNEFDEAGAITIKTPMELFNICQKLVENEEYSEHIRENINQRINSFIESDGNNTQRIFSVIEELVSTNKHSDN